MNQLRFSVFAFFVLVSTTRADGPADNVPDRVRPIPPAGIVISSDDRRELNIEADRLAAEIESLRNDRHDQRSFRNLWPDVQIFHKAVRWALDYNEFFKTNETRVARALLKEGLERARQLKSGVAPWLTATGLVVRGYVSSVDGSVQPYGLIVPPTFRPHDPHLFRLDIWLHGRGETLSELSFINERMKSFGDFTPPNAFVVHPYSRYCNGSRFAGETDLFEVIEHAKSYYPLDDNRTVVRGFSLGGAACWHLAVHHAWRWVAAAPGAGFSETADFLRIFQNEALKPSWYEQRLWHLYDATDYAENLFHCPTVAYSGQIDKQKQAADIMSRALAAAGIDLVHIIGPQTGHKYHPEAKEEINRRLDAIAARGRDLLPHQIRFTTWTLRYNRMHWVVIDALEEHWRRARVEADLRPHANSVRLMTTNVAALTLVIPPGLCPFDPTRPTEVEIDGQKLEASRPQSDRSWQVRFSKAEKKWELASATENDGESRKRHGLQGPLDDAFMDSFLMVRPTGQPLHSKTGTWVSTELAHATNHWRKYFRGDARVKDDTEVTDADIAAHHLVLWGDPSSNRLLSRIAARLPIRWEAETIIAGSKTFASSHHMPLFVYPNPLSPGRYVVLNSGFTFREYDYLNNARQTPKLPDYAVVDVNQPATSRAVGGIVIAGFFDEDWRWAAQ